MKKTAVGLCLLLVLTGLALPQNKKGTWFVGTSFGSAGYTFSHSESGSSASTNVSLGDSNYYSFSFYPTIGYYFLDNLVLGAYFSTGIYGGKSDYSYSNTTDTSVSKYTQLYVSVGPFIRVYLGQEGGKGRPYIHAYVQKSLYPLYEGESIPSPGSGYKYKYTNYSPINAGIQVGYEHYLNPTVGLQYYIGYSFYTYSYDTEYDYSTGTDPTYNSKYYSHGISFGVGLQIHLNREKK